MHAGLALVYKATAAQQNYLVAVHYNPACFTFAVCCTTTFSLIASTLGSNEFKRLEARNLNRSDVCTTE